MHGHCDRCAWIGCTIDGGASLGGRSPSIEGGSVRSSSDYYAVGSLGGHCIRFREVKGGLYTIDGVKCYADHASGQSGGDNVLSWDMFEADSTALVSVRNLTVHASVHNAVLGYISCQSVDEVGFVVDGLDYHGLAASKAPVLLVQGFAAASFTKMIFKNVSGLSIQTDTLRCKQTTLRSCDVDRSDSHGHVISLAQYAGVQQFVDVVGCSSNYNDQIGILLAAANVTDDVFVSVRGCRFINNGQAVPTSLERTSLYALRLKSVELTDNTWGDSQGSATQAWSYTANVVATLFGGGNRQVVSALTPSLTTVTTNREEQNSGGLATVASAAAFPLAGPNGVISVSGTTNITSITGGNWAGRIITLIFQGVLTFTDGSNLKLAGNFVTTANDTITLRGDGTDWYEMSRSAN